MRTQFDIDPPLDRGPLVVGAIDRARKSDEGVVERSFPLLFPYSILDLPDGFVQSAQFLLQQFYSLPLHGRRGERQKRLQFPHDIVARRSVMQSIGLDLQDGDLVDQFAPRNRDGRSGQAVRNGRIHRSPIFSASAVSISRNGSLQSPYTF